MAQYWSNSEVCKALVDHKRGVGVNRGVPVDGHSVQGIVPLVLHRAILLFYGELHLLIPLPERRARVPEHRPERLEALAGPATLQPDAIMFVLDDAPARQVLRYALFALLSAHAQLYEGEGVILPRLAGPPSGGPVVLND